MCRSPPTPPALLPPLLLLLLLTVSTCTGRVHVQSSPADLGPSSHQGAEGVAVKGHQVLKVYVASNNKTLDVLKSFEDNPGEWHTY